MFKMIEMLKTTNKKMLMNLSRFIKEATKIRNESIMIVSGNNTNIAVY